MQLKDQEKDSKWYMEQKLQKLTDFYFILSQT